jgi:Dyp-type peroxidase family
MALNLDASLPEGAATGDTLAMLDDLQGNILKGHGRHATINMFIRFGADQAKARAFVKAVGALTISARTQLDQIAKHKADPNFVTPVFVTLMLSKAGYAALGASAKAPTGDAGFDAGLLARRASLNDPLAAKLDAGYRNDPHAFVLIAGDPDDEATFGPASRVETTATKVLNLLSGAGTVVATETGRAIFRTQEEDLPAGQDKSKEGIEHFGYVDGRSQPLLMKEQITKEATGGDGITVWNPEFPLRQVLVKDPGSTGGKTFGSFFVFRKLDQNVKAFKAEEAVLGGNGPNGLNTGEQAGATIVGRFEDGTPIVLQRAEGAGEPVMNNFGYNADPAGVRCPLHAHIRKTNPRGDSARFNLDTEANERKHIMARRGITYGTRNSIVDPTDEPTKDVGLLFMAYQSSIVNQFEFTQIFWANNASFPKSGTGIDPIIGQPGKASLKHNKKWGDPSANTKAGSFGGHVTMRGGGYFFAPARSTLLAM